MLYSQETCGTCMTRVHVHIWMGKTEDMFWCYRASCLKRFTVVFFNLEMKGKLEINAFK